MYADSTNRPIANAEVRIASVERAVHTDTAGTFRMTGVPAGLHILTIRALGFTAETQRIPLRDGQTHEGDYFLKRAPQRLEAVDVTADATAPASLRLKMSGFEDRQRLGFGRFFTPEDFEKNQARKLPEILLTRIPGIRISYQNGRRYLVSKRPATGFGNRPCYVRVFLNGMPYADADELGLKYGAVDADAMDTSNFLAAEWYETSSTPLQFNPTAKPPCGTLLLWTK